MLVRLRAKLDKLVRVKTALAVANADAYERIFRLAELKGLVTTLEALETKSGVFHEGGGYGHAVHEVEYAAQLGKAEVDQLVAGLKNEVQSLQDALDEFNFSHTVSL